MAVDSLGTKNQPQFDGGASSNLAADLTAIADYAAAVGNRKAGTHSARLALSGADVWEGLDYQETDTGTGGGPGNRYTYASGAWVLTGGDSHWKLSTLTVQSGWGSLQDPNGVTSGSSLAGGSRQVGQQVELRFRVARTGADLVAGSSGNLSPDPTVAILTSALRPASVVYGHFFDSGVSSGSARVYPDGTVQLTDIYPSDTISNGDIVTIQIMYFLG